MSKSSAAARGRRAERLPIGREIKWGAFRGLRKFETPWELPAGYAEMLVKMLHAQASSEIMSVLTFRDYLDGAPTLDDRWALARVIADEMRHGMQVCRVLEDFGGAGRAVVAQVMAMRLGQAKLDAFNEPLESWGDLLAFMTLIDRVGDFQLRNFEECSYAPLARAIPLMLHEEQFHIAIGVNGMRRMVSDAEYYGSAAEAQALVDRWYPRALDMFGHSGSAASRQAIEWGIKKWDNDEVRAMYVEEVGQVIRDLGLVVPPPDRGRRIA
jgi:1,2-phenylacetyl-CoA epoxidase catalytic subunit